MAAAIGSKHTGHGKCRRQLLRCTWRSLWDATASGGMEQHGGAAAWYFRRDLGVLVEVLGLGASDSSIFFVAEEWYTANMSPVTASLASQLLKESRKGMGLGWMPGASGSPTALRRLSKPSGRHVRVDPRPLRLLETHCGDALAASDLLPRLDVSQVAYTACDFRASELPCGS